MKVPVQPIVWTLRIRGLDCLGSFRGLGTSAVYCSSSQLFFRSSSPSVAQQDKRFRKACALFEMKLANKELDYDYLDSWDDKCFFDGDEDPDYFHDRDDVEFGSDEDDYQSLAQDLSLV